MARVIGEEGEFSRYQTSRHAVITFKNSGSASFEVTLHSTNVKCKTKTDDRFQSISNTRNPLICVCKNKIRSSCTKRVLGCPLVSLTQRPAPSYFIFSLIKTLEEELKLLVD